MMMLLFILFLATSACKTTQMSVSPKKPTTKERLDLDKLFTGYMFNDESIDIQRATMIAKKTDEFLKLLQKYPSLRNAKDHQGNTLLLRALKGIQITIAGANQEDISEEWLPVPMEWIHALLKAGADTNARDREGKTALHHAAQTVNVPLMETIIAYHPDTTLKDNASNRAADYLVSSEEDDADTKKSKAYLSKLIAEYEENRIKQAHSAFRNIYETTGYNLPERTVSIITHYDVKKEKTAKKNDPE
jgi:hypothetical protein